MTQRLHVGNLAPGTSEEALREIFLEIDRDVASIEMVKDRRTGRPRGAAYVELPGDDADEVILALDGIELDGREITVTRAGAEAADAAAPQPVTVDEDLGLEDEDDPPPHRRFRPERDS